MRRYAEVALRLEEQRNRLLSEQARIIGMLQAGLDEVVPAPGPTIVGRIKSAPSVWLKMHRYDLALDEVRDLLGIRVIVERVVHCYRVADTATELWRGQFVRGRDYIAHPKANGYRAIHLCFHDPARAPVGLQIRTRAMEECCGPGTAHHARYKASTWKAFVDQWGQATDREWNRAVA